MSPQIIRYFFVKMIEIKRRHIRADFTPVHVTIKGACGRAVG